MKKITLLFLIFTLFSCDAIRSNKIKSIVELTPQLSVEINEPIIVDNDLKKNVYNENISKQPAYKLTSNIIISEPAFAKGVIYVTDNAGKVYAFSKKEKSTLWVQNISPKFDAFNLVGGGVTYNDGKLYITNGSRFLVVLDCNTGQEIVRKEFPDIIRIKPIMINNDIILIQTVSNQLIAYNLKTTNIIWQHEGVFETLSSTHYIKPILYNSNVIVSYSSGQIFSLDAKTGEEKWGLNLSSQNDVTLPNYETVTLTCAPIIYNDIIYLASSTGKLIKLSLNDGSVIWQATARDVQSMSLNGNSLFITNNAKQLAAISTITGKVKWIADFDLAQNKRKSKAVHFLNPKIMKMDQGYGVIVVTSFGEIYKYQTDETGNLNNTPIILKTIKNIQYNGCTCCGDNYLLSDKQIIFIEE